MCHYANQININKVIQNKLRLIQNSEMSTLGETEAKSKSDSTQHIWEQASVVIKRWLRAARIYHG